MGENVWDRLIRQSICALYMNQSNHFNQLQEQEHRTQLKSQPSFGIRISNISSKVEGKTKKHFVHHAWRVITLRTENLPQNLALELAMSLQSGKTKHLKPTFLWKPQAQGTHGFGKAQHHYSFSRIKLAYGRGISINYRLKLKTHASSF